MAFQNHDYQIPPFSGPPPPRRRWWSRPIVTLPATNDRKATCMETTVCISPCFGSIFTIVAVMVYMLYFVDNAQCDAKFAIQSIAVSPSSTIWHVDFLVKNPSSRFSIYYEGYETAVSLGSLSTAVLNTYHERKSPSHTAFSVDFVAEGNLNDVVSEQLDIKLRAKHKTFGDDYANDGYVDIMCHNLTRSHENVEKIHCHSSFTKLKILYRNQLFVSSVSVSNADPNVSAADWTIGFVARSPVTGCEISIQTLNSRLLRRGDVVSKSSSPSLGYFVTGDKAEVVFEKVVMPGSIGDVVWDSQVEIMFAVNTNAMYLNGFLLAACPTIPVKITTDQAGEVMGSLLGNMRRCDYIYQKNLA
ncbi:PREDICTED: uncharacterized protein LOC104738095 [Camelina sativa]|uniref:Uncharacterized protein LOC104738095 n=1 Tax=Camelina sativa TaxID=90675 RepID=A0ABM0VIC8_CAMSA|nr:PREDICTED: uncharacterized protein LOC104738095 [Camelina sativa]